MPYLFKNWPATWYFFTEALTALAHLARSEKTKALVFIDEFQDIVAADSAKAIQGAIRHVAQATSDLMFIFSGSNRHLLLELFDDKSMPLYMLCDRLLLDRIASTHYWPFLQKLAQLKWNQELTRMAFDKIISLTELHPFYINFLCSKLWMHKQAPTVQDVSQAWLQCYEDEERRLIAELEKLTKNQQDLLKSLALEPTTSPTGRKFLNKTKMAYSSIRQTLKVLMDKDMVYKVRQEDAALPSIKKNQLRVLDPLLAFALRKYS